MANTFKLKTKANVGITTQNVYVVPSATTTVVIGITLANTSGTGCLVGVGITRPSTDDVKLLKNAPIPQGSSLEFMAGNKVVLETADTITVDSDSNNSIDASLTIMEIT
nr:virion structural protein [uncultured Mediterranean phage uvMED]